VIPTNGPGTGGAQPPDYGIGIRAIADDVTEHDHAVDRGQRREHGIECLQVAVDVG
jgi:hypothetical protein